MEDERLHVVITYKFPDGRVWEENALFVEPELIQEKWSWKELKDGKPEREFAADFLAGTASAHISKDNKDVSDKIDIVPGQTFAGFGFTIALGLFSEEYDPVAKRQLGNFPQAFTHEAMMHAAWILSGGEPD